MLDADPARRPDAGQVRSALTRIGAPVWPRRTLVVAGALVVVAGLVTTFSLLGASPASRQGPGASPSSGPVLGEPRTADPCALLKGAPLNRFGDSNPSEDQWLLEQCNDVLKRDGEDYANVGVVFAKTSSSAPLPPQAEQKGRFSVVQDQEDPGRCAWRVLLPDQYEIDISVSTKKDAPVCDIAKATKDHVVDVLDQGTIPRRPDPAPNSLQRQNACTPHNETAFAKLPGIATAKRESGFADWQCAWAADTVTYSITFGYHDGAVKDSREPLLDIADRPAIRTTSEDHDACELAVSNLTRKNRWNALVDETVWVKVTANGMPSDQRCALTDQLATAYFAPR